MATSTTRKDSKTTPVHKIRVGGGIVATIWPNEGKDGRIFYNTTVVRTYKNEADEYVETDSYLDNQLLELSAVAQMAFVWITQRQVEDRTERQN